MRRLIVNEQTPALVELGGPLRRMPAINSFAWHVFFGRGSFPDVDLRLAPQSSISE
jgi:hypothetical protein